MTTMMQLQRNNVVVKKYATGRNVKHFAFTYMVETAVKKYTDNTWIEITLKSFFKSFICVSILLSLDFFVTS